MVHISGSPPWFRKGYFPGVSSIPQLLSSEGFGSRTNHCLKPSPHLRLEPCPKRSRVMPSDFRQVEPLLSRCRARRPRPPAPATTTTRCFSPFAGLGGFLMPHDSFLSVSRRSFLRLATAATVAVPIVT